MSRPRIGFLGPPGTFTEQALLTQPDLAGCQPVAMNTIPDVLVATERGEVDLGFVPIENAIEGTVNVAQDILAFEANLLIQREVVIDIHLHLLGVNGAAPSTIKTVVSHSHALAQVRKFLRQKVPAAEIQASTSTAEAARFVAESNDPAIGAIGNSLAADLYGLDIVNDDIADHQGNQTRFVLVSRTGVPAQTGHDKTSLVVYQRADAPGSLLAILQEFAARRINLMKLESRPTRQGLGDYCFLMDLEGHISDEVIGHCLLQLKMKHGGVQFLGSYPAAGDAAESNRDEAQVALDGATAWLDGLRSAIVE